MTALRQRRPHKPDLAYRRSFKGRACEACGRQDDTVVGAHMRLGNYTGIGIKPPDSDIAALCSTCHALDGGLHSGRVALWNRVLRNLLRRRYLEWKDRND